MERSPFVNGYIEAMLFCWVEEEQEQANDAEFGEGFEQQIIGVCEDFQSGDEVAECLQLALQTVGYDEQQAGRDFYFTRNGHGVGYWDRGLGDVGERLTKSAAFYKSSNEYLGDDGKIYHG